MMPTPSPAPGGAAVRRATVVQRARADERARRWREPALYARLAAVAVLLLIPLTVSSFQVMDLALKIALFATLVASYDILIGYTGIVSFGHAMFFGLGAYTVGLSLGKFGAPSYGYLALGFLTAILSSALLAFLIGAFPFELSHG